VGRFIKPSLESKTREISPHHPESMSLGTLFALLVRLIVLINIIKVSFRIAILLFSTPQETIVGEIVYLD